MQNHSNMIKFVCLFITVTLELIMAEYQWSGYVNPIKEDFDFICEDNLAITGIASEFNTVHNDRQWEFQCSSGGGVANVSSNCSLQDPINAFALEFNFECPDNGYIAGIKSTFSDSEDDRVWQPYCCTRPYSGLIDCEIPSSQWENNVELLLNWTTTNGRVLTGMQTFFSSFNRDRRWRFKQCTLQVSCGDPGIPDNAIRHGNSFLYQDEVTFICNNGYYQSSGPVGGVRQCLDTGLWSDMQPICSLCTNIDNCADIRCTSSSDQYCEECESNQGFALGEKGYENLNTSCEPLCSWLQSFCFPGECPGGYTSCNCTEGFDGLDCLEIIAEPDLDSCEIQITSPEVMTSACNVNGTLPIYINFIPTNLLANWITSFVVDSVPTQPSYVHSYQIGIAQADVVTSVYRMNSYPSISVTSTSNACTVKQISPDIPQEMVDCVTSVSSTDLDSHTFLHGDWFKAGILITNGGFLNITDLDANQTNTHYYSGSSINPFSLFVIDTEPPTHCKVVQSQTCLSDQVILTESLVSDNKIQLTWGGWNDMPSQVLKYKIEVHKLIYNSVTGYLDEEMSPVYTKEIQSNNDLAFYTIQETDSLPSESPYSIILFVFDVAGNIQYARRIIIYDDNSELKEDTNVPIKISSGVEEPSINAFWHNSTTDPIVVSGKGHFYNENLETDNWLAPAAVRSPPVLSKFDDEDRFGVKNSLGITSLYYQYIIDQEAGQSISALNQPLSFLFETNDLALSAVQVSPNVTDNDSVTIWFKANDFKNNSAYERVLVHMDSSSPVVEELGLVKNGVSELLSLYGLKSLLNLEVQFNAHDIHSGLDNIQWTLETDSEVIGNGEVPVTDYNKDACLMDNECICDKVDHCQKTVHSIMFLSSDFNPGLSEATHDTDYYLTVTAYNHALLYASVTKQFTVDLTPSLIGAVIEKHWNNQIYDIDYQSHLSFTVEWEGFFDRESAILVYQYIVDTQCANVSSFQYPNLGASIAVDTVETWFKWNASTPGTYYTTVVAFNGAYQASDPVCSDGITIDMEPPEFKGVYVPGARVHNGIVTVNEEVWLIHENRERSLVNNPSLDCVNKSLKVSIEQIQAYPIRCSGPNSTCISSIECTNYHPFNSHTYTPIDTLLNITWSAIDNVGIKDYQFGIASTNDYIISPDIVQFTSTAGFPHFSSHNSLFKTANMFYVVIKAIDLSMQESIVSVGPITIDITPPILNDTINRIVEDDVIVISWENWNIVDDEDIFPLTYKYSIGRTKYGDDVHSFASFPSHSKCVSSTCLAIDTTSMGFEKGNEYHVTMKVENTARLVKYIPIEPYTIPFILDSNCISVFEFGTDSNVQLPKDSCDSFFAQQYDQDILFSDNGVTVGWYGLTDSHLNASFSIAIGTLPGLSNIIPFQNAGNQNSLQLSSDSLKHGITYYSTVKIMNQHSVVIKSSDGFKFLSKSTKGAEIWNGLSDYFSEEYHLSSSEISAHWYFPSSISNHVSYYEWALYKANGHDVHNLTIIMEYESVGSLTWGIRPGELDYNTIYVTSVKACFKSDCLESIYSDGFFVASPPDASASNIEAWYSPNTVDNYGYSSSGKLTISWDVFVDQVDITHYQWAVGTGDNGDELLTTWTTSAADVLKVNTTFTKTISLHRQYYVTVRGINVAGLETSHTSSLSYTLGDFAYNDIIVYDVSANDVPDQNTEIEFFENDYTELDYTNTNTTLSAVWPNLRYAIYNYSISTDNSFYSCGNSDDNPAALACGSTQYNGITVSGLNLTHGQTYYFCIQAKAHNVFTPYPSPPETITSCSNGIMAYLTPPTGNCVQIRSSYRPEELPTLTSDETGSADMKEEEESLQYNDDSHCENIAASQSSTTELRIIWDSFSDQIQGGPHDTRIAYYEYAIGSSMGTENVVQFKKVGAVASVVVTGLTLQHGITYYATIRGTDYTGRQSLVMSQGVTIDMTPPTFGNIWLNTRSTIAINSLEEVTPQWDLIVDEQSSISKLYWCLGSEEGTCDLYTWKEANVTDLTGKIGADLYIPDGQPIRVNVLAVNNAGLASISSSPLIMYDSTPPCSGHVFDGPKEDDTYLDLDYSSDHTSIDAHWEPFWDPHTTISNYQWAIGTCSGCSNVMPFITTGLLTDVHKVLSLKQGETYYVTVKGCSIYSGCTLSYSDSITIDVTGPVIQPVNHGLQSSPLLTQFQASRRTVYGHWSLVHDSESQISHYIYYIGTSPNDDSYVSRTTIPSSQNEIVESAPFKDMGLLPIGGTVYITLEVYNRVGMVNIVSSRGVVISDAPPFTLEAPFIDVDWSGSLVNDTQYVKSALLLNYFFSDANVMVDKYFWSLVFEEGTRQLVKAQISYKGNDKTLTGLELSDGLVLSAVVIGCNQAGVCTQSVASPVTIDSTAPIDGYFALHTSTSASLPWAIQDGMNIYNDINGTTLSVTFTGFLDPQTGVSEYWTIIGSTYMSSDLYKSSESLSNIASHSNNDILVSSIRLTRNLTNDETVFISLWAVNSVGLRSNIVQGTFRTVLNGNDIQGSLKLMRSQLCPIESCEGHCTCNERGHLCDTISSCTVLNNTNLDNNQKIEVSNFVSQAKLPLEPNEPLFTSVSDKLTATVQYPVDSLLINFVDWSVGEQGMDVGSGVIDTALDPVWFPLVLNINPIVFHVSPLYPLVVGKTYVFYLRVWYSSTDYAIFESNGVTFDNQGPLINEGYQVKEVRTPLSTMDIDYSPSSSNITLKWTNLFSKQYSTNYSNFELCIGRSPGSDNTYPCTMVTGSTTTLTDLSLVDNTFYYSSVKAMNSLGSIALSISDGFLVDLSPPEVGVVFDGKGHLDQSASTLPDTSYGHLFGFNDPHSNIKSFSAKFRNQYNTDYPHSDIGISRSFEITHDTLPNGNTSMISVIAYNRAGLSSELVTSTGSVYDSTAPVLFECGNVNLLQTSSFDWQMDNDCSCTDNNWSLIGGHTLYHYEELWGYVQSIPQDSCCALELEKGSSVSQTFETIKDERHTVSFWVLLTDKSPIEVLVECNDMETVILKEKTLLRASCNQDEFVRWQKVTYVFTPYSDNTTITITAPSYRSIIIDNVKVIYCSDQSPLVTNILPISITTRPDLIVWPIDDFESGIAEFEYAIGTVKGGVQIQPYQSTGTINGGFYDLSDIKHNTNVYYSVKATNQAGITSIYYSDSIIIDETPPITSDKSVKEILELNGMDVDYSKETYIVLDWSGIVDEQSGIEHCIWALGSSPGWADILDYSLSSETYINITNLYSLLTHGSIMYTTVICLNKAGYSVSAVSDGLTLITEPLSNHNADIMVYNPALTECPAKQEFVSSDSVQFVWNGFGDSTEDSPIYYQMKIVKNGESPDMIEWKDMGSLKQITVKDLSTLSEDVAHSVMVRAYTVQGVYSDTIEQSFTMISSAPIVKDNISLNVTQAAEHLYIEWQNVFTSPGPLYYEVSIGTNHLGSSSILKLSTTEDEYIEINEPNIEQYSVYFLSIRAVSYGGLSTHSNYMIDNAMTVKI